LSAAVSWLRRWWPALAILVLAGALRTPWLTADPPTATSVGIVWHDEGAWTHNARNQALWGVWRTDEWNPLFIAPVFTALEWLAFEAAGVGLWQARLVPLLSGLVAIAAVMVGLAGVAGRRSALLAGLLLATSYTFVMWNRAALMESTMTMFMVVSWAAYARSQARPALGMLAGVAATLAFFTKAAAAFFVAALVVESAIAWWTTRNDASRPWWHPFAPVVGLAVAGIAALAVFVLPHWTEFQFYNWVMTVERKPVYTVAALIERASWLPVVHGTFTRMWPVLVLASLSALAVTAQWRTAPPAARLLVLWVLIGLLELIVHASGEERRYVMFIPAIAALAGLNIDRSKDRQIERSTDRKIDRSTDQIDRSAVVAVGLLLGFLVCGSLLRLVWADAVAAQDYRMTVRTAALLAEAAGGWVWWRHRPSGPGVPSVPGAALLLAVAVTVGADLWLYRGWVQTRTFFNVEASRLVGRLLTPDTLVHGKLANGLALENRIHPLFVGRGFGNYTDRLSRDDARYILTYTQPRLGYEGPVILDVLRHYPQQRVLAEFEVFEETTLTPGPDRAALIDKFPDGPDPRARHQ
jgi:4-amino-4-deoxy-L-arabinose transferase-like glycosyltransferase